MRETGSSRPTASPCLEPGTAAQSCRLPLLLLVKVWVVSLPFDGVAEGVDKALAAVELRRRRALQP